MPHPIPTRVHAVTDYLTGLALIAVPYFISDTRGIEMWLPMALGVGILLQSLITNFEFSLADWMPVRGHLAMDATLGGLLAISPFLFGFDDIVLWPHVILGVGLIGGAVMTEKFRRDQPLPAATMPPRGRRVTN